MDKQAHDFSERPHSLHLRAKVDGEDDQPCVPSISLPPVRPIRWLFGFGALFLPFVVMTVFIIATREWIIIDDTLWDYLGGSLSIAAGLVCVWQLPVPRLSRALISLVYVPVVGYFLVGFSIGFVMQRYNVWL